ncbi:MAG: IMPACT family protein [Chitinophagales bacterium]
MILKSRQLLTALNWKLIFFFPDLIPSSPALLPVNSYKTIQSACEGIYTDSGSKFIAYGHPISTDADLKTQKELLKKMHPKAVHIVSASRQGFAGEIEKSSDDGEPSGSAGKPVLNEMKRWNITNAGLFVVRYFGGKKLGIPGLINAYGTAASNCLDSAKIEVVSVKEGYRIICNEKDSSLVIHELHKAGVKILDMEFGETCNFKIECERAQNEKIIKRLTALWQIKFEHLYSA